MTQDWLKKLVAVILRDISQSIVVADDLSAFLDSFCNVRSAGDLETLMAEAADELDVVYEKVLFPSIDVQEGAEGIIENTVVQQQDLAVLYADIGKQYRGTPLVFSDNSTLTLSPPGPVLYKYIDRLHLTRRLPDRLTDAIEGSVYAGYKMTARVVLRNSTALFQPADMDFLCRVIIRFGFDVQNFDAIYCFAVKTIEENIRGLEYKDLVQARKQAYSELKTRVQKLQATLEQSTVESMMMQGITIPSQPIETIEETVRVIDLVLMSFY